MPTPRHTPTTTTRRTVEILIASGSSHTTVAKVLGITKKTLRKHYALQMANAHDMANARVVQRLFTSILSGSTTAMIFWLKCRAGWKEGVKVELDRTMPFLLEELTAEERNTLRQLLAKSRKEHFDHDRD